MFSSEIPATSPSPSSSELESKKEVAFEMNGVLLDVSEFDSKNGNNAASAAEKMLRANESARAEDAGVPALVRSDYERTSVVSPEKTDEVLLEEFIARLDEAMLNLESLSSSEDSDAIAGLGIINLREGVGEDSENSAEPNGETESRFSEWARKRKLALLVAIGLSVLPQSASAQDNALLGNMWRIIETTTIHNIENKTGEMARKPWEIARQRENEAERRRQEQQYKQQQAESEHKNKIQQFESATAQYRNSLKQRQLQFDEQFNRIKDSFASQSVRVSTPEQAKMQEQSKWLSWLELSRNTIQELKRQDAQYEQSGGSQSEESWQMQSKLRDFVKKAEAKLGIQNDEESPLKMVSDDSFRGEFRSTSTQPRRSGMPSGNYERGPSYSYPSR